jgi:hypothetical protein
MALCVGLAKFRAKIAANQLPTASAPEAVQKIFAPKSEFASPDGYYPK